MQINVEGISKAKSEVLEILLLEQNVDILLIQETHTSDEEQLSKRGFINGYTVAGATYHSKYGTATYVRKNLKWKFIQATDYNNIFIIQIEINNLSVSNIYKPPNISWTLLMTLNIQHPSVVMGDFNSHHTT
jgi:exonuclease III